MRGRALYSLKLLYFPYWEDSTKPDPAKAGILCSLMLGVFGVV